MGEFGVMNKALKRNVAALLLLGILGLPQASHSFDGKQEAAEKEINYASAQQDILKFETVIDDVIGGTFRSSPFALVQKTKGAYLKGYGISFAFLVNIHRAVVTTPFGRKQSRAAATPELKKKIIEELKEKLIQALQSNGKGFRELGKQDRVTIIAFIEDRNFPDEPNANKTIILSALKKDLDELGNNNERFKEFKQRIKIVEY
jgi:hypothetical protein